MAVKRLASSSSSIEMKELAERLKDKGIECVVTEENIRFDQALGMTTTLRVEEDVYDEAKAIYDAFLKEIDDYLPWCPDCGAEDVTAVTIATKHGPTWQLVVAFLIICPVLIAPLVTDFNTILLPGSLLMGLALLCLGEWFRPHKYKKYTCNKCGKVFSK